MNYESLEFAALETARVAPVTGCNELIAVAKHLHTLGTTHAYRALGGMLSSNLIETACFDKRLDDYVHNEVWAHLIDDVSVDSSGSRIAAIAKDELWSKVDFIVLLTMYRGSKENAYTDKLEVRAVINSTKDASPQTVDAFGKFILSLWGLWSGKSIFFKGIEKYLLEGIPGLEYLIQFHSLNYALDSKDWGKTSFFPEPFSESLVAQKLQLTMTEISAPDLAVMKGQNFYNPDNKYIQLCCPATSCIRRTGDRAPIAWICCHADYQMGVLRTVDEYQGRGLAKYVIHDLGNKMIKDFAAKVSSLYKYSQPNDAYVIQMIAERSNRTPIRLYENFGFRLVAEVTWAECRFHPAGGPPKL
ncbi:hypothetical protein LPJ63_002581 [Coemansia sp. RSA 2711]|nr:hypothetical protein LPJ63_002581 [Coemansia sp. RSA 2711]KAJ2304165.1 hypothetical protein IWW54_005495 [Coemansia sp. RSA 2705]KAJ2322276.1 hypothetical protein IWW51_004243 [Coemansia sp. RSA 2702]KAJ2365721.1 hypothetical protein H4S01_003093 [Coemansia sp. RSA 2610]